MNVVIHVASSTLANDWRYVNVPYRLKTDKCLVVEKAACGNNHSIVLTKDNEIYTFGNNKYYQCYSQPDGSVINPLGVPCPRLFSKKQELGISEHSLCTDIIALNYGTLIVMNGV